jgi:hypothetical protein
MIFLRPRWGKGGRCPGRVHRYNNSQEHMIGGSSES